MIGARLRLMGQLTAYKVTSECLSFSLLLLSVLTLCLGFPSVADLTLFEADS